MNRVSCALQMVLLSLLAVIVTIFFSSCSSGITPEGVPVSRANLEALEARVAALEPEGWRFERPRVALPQHQEVVGQGYRELPLTREMADALTADCQRDALLVGQRPADGFLVGLYRRPDGAVLWVCGRQQPKPRA